MKFIGILLFLSMQFTIFSTDDLDSLLGDPDSTVADTNEDDSLNLDGFLDQKDQIDENEPESEEAESVLDQILEDESAKVSIAYSIKAGVINSFLSSDIMSENYFTESYVFEPLLSNPVYFKIDLRPMSYLRFYTSVETRVDVDTVSYVTPEIDQLFLEYTISDMGEIRFGKQKASWGKALILENFADYASEIEDSISARLFFPVLNNGLSLYLYTNEELFHADVEDWKKIGLSALLDTAIGDYNFGFSARLERTEKAGFTGFVTTVLGFIDITSELSYLVSHESTYSDEISWLTSFLYEHPETGIQLGAEYIFNPSRLFMNDFKDTEFSHTAGLFLFSRKTRLFGWKTAAKWVHDFTQHSGEVSIAFSRGILPKVSMDVIIPVSYNNYVIEYEDVDLPGSSTSLILLFRLSDTFTF